MHLLMLEFHYTIGAKKCVLLVLTKDIKICFCYFHPVKYSESRATMNSQEKQK